MSQGPLAAPAAGAAGGVTCVQVMCSEPMPVSVLLPDVTVQAPQQTAIATHGAQFQVLLVLMNTLHVSVADLTTSARERRRPSTHRTTRRRPPTRDRTRARSARRGQRRCAGDCGR